MVSVIDYGRSRIDGFFPNCDEVNTFTVKGSFQGGNVCYFPENYGLCSFLKNGISILSHIQTPLKPRSHEGRIGKAIYLVAESLKCHPNEQSFYRMLRNNYSKELNKVLEVVKEDMSGDERLGYVTSTNIFQFYVRFICHRLELRWRE